MENGVSRDGSCRLASIDGTLIRRGELSIQCSSHRLAATPFHFGILRVLITRGLSDSTVTSQRVEPPQDASPLR